MTLKLRPGRLLKRRVTSTPWYPSSGSRVANVLGIVSLFERALTGPQNPLTASRLPISGSLIKVVGFENSKDISL